MPIWHWGGSLPEEELLLNCGQTKKLISKGLDVNSGKPLRTWFQCCSNGLSVRRSSSTFTLLLLPTSVEYESGIGSVKSALYTCVRSQPVPEEMLLTVLLEVEAILNSKPLGYVSADVTDVDPVTPHSLLMGWPDGSLPQVVYPDTEILSCRCWPHSQVLADQFWSRFKR